MAKQPNGPCFVWARNRNAAGRGNDPMPQIIHQDVGVAHLEIVATHPIPVGMLLYIPDLIALFPPPRIEP